MIKSKKVEDYPILKKETTNQYKKKETIKKKQNQFNHEIVIINVGGKQV